MPPPPHLHTSSLSVFFLFTSSQLHKPPMQMQKATEMRLPTLNVHCAICGVSTVLTVRVDSRMTGEGLREAVFSQYHTYCRDEGVKFAPPSLNPMDYAVYAANDSGQTTTPLVLFKTSRQGNGDTVRDQMALLPSPHFAVMRIGEAFLQRDAVVQDESIEREVIIEKRNKLMQSVSFLDQVSCEKAIELQLYRERQETLVSKVEDMMLYAYVAYQRYEAKIEVESDKLRRLDVTWREQCVPWIAQAMETLDTQKRIYMSASVIAMKAERNSAIHGTGERW